MSKTVKEIVSCWLKDNGYDGLGNSDGECGCRIGDLMPCGYTQDNCVAAYIVECAKCIKRDSCGFLDEYGDGVDWMMFTEKDWCMPEYETKEAE